MHLSLISLTKGAAPHEVIVIAQATGAVTRFNAPQRTTNTGAGHPIGTFLAVFIHQSIFANPKVVFLFVECQRTVIAELAGESEDVLWPEFDWGV